MKRKKKYFKIFLFYILILCACQNSESNSEQKNIHSYSEKINTSKIDEPEENQKSITVYLSFLEGNLKSSDGYEINDIIIPTGEPEKRYPTRYAFFDSTGDGMPDLHVDSTRYYYIFTFQNDELLLWNDLSPYPQYYALSNGAFISWRQGAAPEQDYYCYYAFNHLGNIIIAIPFTRYDKNENGFYDNEDEHSFSNVDVTKEIWDGLVDNYIDIGQDGNSRIRNQIEWKVLYE